MTGETRAWIGARVLLAAVAAASCGGSKGLQPSNDAGACAVGSVRCACTKGGACDPGLTCASGLCVKVPEPDAGPSSTCGPGTYLADGECLATPVDAGVTVVVVPADGGDALSCGPGTHLVGDQCLGVVTPDAGPAPTCGTGTHLDGGVCTPDGPTLYEVRIAVSSLPADGFSKIPVLAIGRKADGTPATDAVVFSTDRAGAGTFDSPQVTLGPLGAQTYFQPCSSAVAGCTGALKITLALASAPATIVASADVTLTAPAGVGSDAPCLTGGNVIFYDGTDYIFDGTETITLGTWSASGSASDVTIHVTPASQQQGLWWDLEFSTRNLAQQLAAQVYTNAERAPFASPGHPGLEISGDGRGCNTLSGSFQVEDIQWSDTTLKSFTATFEQHCEEGANALRGCVHFQQ
ncbi:MAG TPA: hypothetical protein VHL80_12395 [Polyangia bacterium]|nr:hypothetical protein [Polyangia bacterium]